MKSLTATQKYSESCISKLMLFSHVPRNAEVITINFGWGMVEMSWRPELSPLLLQF